MDMQHSRLSLLLAAALALPSSPLMAGSDGLVGGIVGGIVGGAVTGHILKEDQKEERQKQKQKQQQKQSQSVYVADRTENRSIQNGLNYFGFPAGTADGVLGPSSRNAISQYQSYLGFQATGQLTQFEKEFLINSYNRAQAGGFATMQQAASLPDGSKGLLLKYRDELAGASVAAETTTTEPAGQSSIAVDASIPDKYQGEWYQSGTEEYCGTENDTNLYIHADSWEWGAGTYCALDMVLKAEDSGFLAEYACEVDGDMSKKMVEFGTFGDSLILKIEENGETLTPSVHSRCE